MDIDEDIRELFSEEGIDREDLKDFRIFYDVGYLLHVYGLDTEKE